MGGTSFTQTIGRLGVPSVAMVAVVLLGIPALAGYGPDSGDYSFFDTPTAWNPGPNTARVGGFPAPGGATWSIMTSGLGDGTIGGLGVAAHGSNLTVDFDTMVTPAADGYEASVVGAALDIWAAVCGFTNLGSVADGGGGAGASGPGGGYPGDIRVAGWELIAATTLAHAWQPGNEAIFGADGYIAGDVHMDVARTWVDEDDDTTADGDYDFFTVMLHELGHSLGLGHSTVVGALMEPIYAGGHRWLHADDIAGIVAIYGPSTDIPEPAALLLAMIGAGGLALARRRRR